MTESEIRCAVLRSLIRLSFNDTQLRFATRVGKPAGQIADMLATPPRKSFGHKIAREFEKKLGLKPFFFEDQSNAWTDHPPHNIGELIKANQPTAPYSADLTPEEWQIINGFRAASEDVRRIMMTIAMAEQKPVDESKKSARHGAETNSLLESIRIASPVAEGIKHNKQ